MTAQEQLDAEQAKARRKPDVHRMLPQDENAEKGVICSFLLSPKEVGQICIEKGITGQHFHQPRHALFIDLLLEFYRDNEPIDFITLTSCLRSRNQLDQFANGAWITEMETFVGTPSNVGHYLEILEEKCILREVIKTCSEYGSRGYDDQDDVNTLVNGLVSSSSKIMQMLQGRRRNNRTMRDLAQRSMMRLLDRMNGEWKMDMPTGIQALDEATMGFVAPTVTVVAGKPSDGKSSLAMNIAEHLASQHKKKIGIISLDDNDDQVTDRLLQQMAGVSRFHLMKSGKMNEEEDAKMADAAIRLAALEDRMFIRDDGALSPSEINATLSTWQAKHGLDFAIIDHIQLARPDKASGRGSSEDAHAVSRALKPMAKALGIPFLVLSQVTKQTDGSYNTKNSKALEEDANNLWIISHDDAQDATASTPTPAWINIAKQKDGPKTSVPVSYIRAYTRFIDRVAHEPEIVDHYAKKPKKGR